jgi:hypothetical protein
VTDDKSIKDGRDRVRVAGGEDYVPPRTKRQEVNRSAWIPKSIRVLMISRCCSSPTSRSMGLLPIKTLAFFLGRLTEIRASGGTCVLS